MTTIPGTTDDASHAVKDPGPVASIVERAREVWGARGLLLEFTRRDVRVRYRQAVLGIVWALLVPVLTVLAGLVLRAVVSGAGPRGAAWAGGGAAMLAGIALKGVGWAFFASTISSGTMSLVANGALVARVYFPREVLPLSSTLTQAVDLATGLAAVAVLFAVLGVGVGPTVLWTPLLLAMLAALTAALAAVLACVNLFYRDVRHVVQVLVTFGVFFTPVFVDAGQLGARGARLAMLNPVAPLLEGLRLAVVARHDLLQPLVLDGGVLAWSPWYLAYTLLWTVAAVTAASMLYSRLGSVFAEYL